MIIGNSWTNCPQVGALALLIGHMHPKYICFVRGIMFATEMKYIYIMSYVLGKNKIH